MAHDRYLDISLNHLSPKAQRLLITGGGKSVACSYHEYGFWVYAHDDDGAHDPEIVPPDLIGIFQHARKEHCGWIKLDCDGSTIAGLPAFGWSEESARQHASVYAAILAAQQEG